MNAIKSEPVRLYTTPDCGKCKITEIGLERRGIDFQIIDLSTNEEAYDYVTKKLGYTGAPVVVVNENHHWNDFRPDKIASLVRAPEPQSTSVESAQAVTDFPNRPSAQITHQQMSAPPPAY